MRRLAFTAALTLAGLAACVPEAPEESAPPEAYGPPGPRGGGPAPPMRWMPPDTPAGWTGPGGLALIGEVEPEALPDARSRGARLVARYCSQCHGIPSPRRHAAADWPPVVRRMFLRMEHMAWMRRMHGRGMPMPMRRIEAPTPEEQRVIVSYLQAHALDTVAPEALPDGAGEAAALFARLCSRCHALPDPRQHTAEEWPGVVAHMREMKRASGAQDLTDAEAARIVAYLQAHAGTEPAGAAEHRHR